jgi:glycosyltransferase involved in cell wall biosynthesis
MPDDLEFLAKNLGIKDDIVFLSKRDDVPSLMQAMDVFVFPSIFEGLGIVLLEIQGLEVPCVASDVIPKEVVISKGIEFVPVEADASKWVASMKRIMAVMKDEPKKQDILRKSPYNIFENAKKLRKIYLSR